MADSAGTVLRHLSAGLLAHLRKGRMAGLRLHPLALVTPVARRKAPDSIKSEQRRDATIRTFPMVTLFSGFGGVLLTLLVFSGHVLAQRMRGDVAVVATRRRMPSGGAADVA